ncbi:unnamed protein product [Rotaria sp. Silwood1]|nr:unnamed protein product [Rotaria sp. Silwood1]CAF1212309.1 unnamed protein product [Rotaria sp. Silwood1]CAF3495270.1 unnamed protein product [Rotaria sp. Silwood1]CAF4755464.1 unnamed protein product [Rotaria sp. Silwood1]CAF4810526.1 unnamed protein product [Rotaria sp. Silwood1]
MQVETKQHRRRSIIREFCLNTFTPTLPDIARSETILAYFEYLTQINISYVSEWPQYFLVENNTQTAVLGIVEILSNIGGQISLWIGISFILIMKVIKMFYRLIHYQCFLIVRTLKK